MEYYGQVKRIFFFYLFQVSQLGSQWNNGSNAGSFYWNVNNSSANRNRNISRQLLNALKINLYCAFYLPCLLAKHRNKTNPVLVGLLKINIQ
jgi:hypothetical protein